MNLLAQAFKSTPVLIGLSILLVFIEFNVGTVFSRQFNRIFNIREVAPFTYLVAYTFVFLFFLPLLVRKYLAKTSLRDLGLRFPENKKKALLFMFFALLILIPVAYYSAQFKTVQRFYSLKDTPLYFVFFLLLAMPPYYFAEEFFFRGFLFLGLWRNLGWHSYWVTEMIFTWAHTGKPMIELLISFPAGMVLNYLTLHTRSIYPAMVVHFIVGALLMILVTFR